MGESPQRRRELGHRGKPVIGKRCEGPGDGVLHGPRDAGVGSLHGGARFQHGPVVHPAFRHARRGRLPRQHLEQHAAEAVDVGACIEVPEGHCLLRAHVAGRADRLARLGERQAAGGADRARDAEVGDDRVFAREEDVLGLDVAVDDSLAMGESERVGDVTRDMECRLEGQLPIPQQPMPQRLAFDVRHDVVEQPVDLTSRKDRDNVGMAEVRGEVHFPNEPLAQQAGGHLRVEHFDRHAAMRVLLHRQEDPGHAPRADLAFDVVVGRQARAQAVEHVNHARNLADPRLPGERRGGPLADSVPRATISSWTGSVRCGAPPTCGWQRTMRCSASPCGCWAGSCPASLSCWTGSGRAPSSRPWPVATAWSRRRRRSRGATVSRRETVASRNRLVEEATAAAGSLSQGQWALVTFLSMLTALLLVLPVSWVYMLTKQRSGYDQSVVQTVIILPMTVAATVILVQNSLALAFTLAAIVAAVRFRNNLKDTKDAVYIFLALAVGVAAGVFSPTVAAVMSLMFNVVVLALWELNLGNIYADQQGRTPALPPAEGRAALLVRVDVP